MKRKIVLVGGGGHCKVIIDAIRESGKFSIYGITDPNLPKGECVSGVEVIGTDDFLHGLFKKGIKNAFICVGSVANCEARKRIYAGLKKDKFELPVIVHPNAVVANGVKLGKGTFVAAGAVINPDVTIGDNAIINTSSSIDHDCVIGNFVHIAPGVTLSGGVKIGDETHIGTGASVIQYLNIGKKCIIGAGITVRHDMPDNTKNYDKHIKG